MNDHMTYILPAYFLLYFLTLLVMPALAVGRRIGKNPVILSRSDDAHGLIAGYFKLWMALIIVYIILFAAYPASYRYFLPMTYLDIEPLRIVGLVILAASLVWTSASQFNMRTSWRVGIDEKQKTTLVTTGIFRFSRNPIYLGMTASVFGLFLVTPDAFTLLLAVTGYILIQIQIRLEEDFLYRMHGQVYLDYKNAVRRFV